MFFGIKKVEVEMRLSDLDCVLLQGKRSKSRFSSAPVERYWLELIDKKGEKLTLTNWQAKAYEQRKEQAKTLASLLGCDVRDAVKGQEPSPHYSVGSLKIPKGSSSAPSYGGSVNPHKEIKSLKPFDKGVKILVLVAMFVIFAVHLYMLSVGEGIR